MGLIKQKSLRKRRTRHGKLTKKFKGGEYDSTKVVNPEARSESRDSTTTYSGQHYSDNVDRVPGKEQLEQAWKEHMKNIPDLPPGSVLGIGVVVGVISVGAYFLIAKS